MFFRHSRGRRLAFQLQISMEALAPRISPRIGRGYWPVSERLKQMGQLLVPMFGREPFHGDTARVGRARRTHTMASVSPRTSDILRVWFAPQAA